VKLLTPEDLAEMLRVSRATVSRMCAAGSLPCVVLRAGKRKRIVRFREADIEQFITRCVKAGAGRPRGRRKRDENGYGVATKNVGDVQLFECAGESAAGRQPSRLVPA